MSVTDVENQHVDYAEIEEKASLVADMMSEKTVELRCKSDKGAEGSYLEKPLSYIDATSEDALYNAYIYHSYLPEHIVSDASEEMVGICFKVEPTISLPEKIKHLEFHANSKGDSLLSVARAVIRDVIATGRAAISSDFIDGQSTLEHRDSLSLINWRETSQGYTMMVFSESYIDSDGEIQEQRRHYSIESGLLIVTLYRKSTAGKWVEHIDVDEDGNGTLTPTLPNNQRYDYIPIRVAETIKPSLYGMARTVLKGFRISADHYGMMHNLGPTLVIASDSSIEKLNSGFSNGIKIGKDDQAKLLQQGTDGTDPSEKAMEKLFNSAVDQGIRLISTGAAQESGEALYLRNANKQIKVDAVADIASGEIKESLRVCAILENANPDEVDFKLNVELVEEPIEVAELKEMREAVVNSNLIKWSDYLIKAQSHHLIEMRKNEDGTLDTATYIDEATKEFKLLNAESELI